MAKLIELVLRDQEAFLDELSRRKAEDLDKATATVARIIRRVRFEGDRALVELGRLYDGVDLYPGSFLVAREEIERAAGRLDRALCDALSEAYSRICDYHRAQLPDSWSVRGPDGEIMGQRIGAVESAAVYAPGGKAAYPSSVLMGVAAARTAGVQRVVLLSPPSRDGGLNPAVLFAARLGGVAEIYRLGGAQAVAAAAYGTATVPRVDVIVGPGNIYVTTAKKLVYGTVNVDMLAGPSEILVIADRSADPAWVAADMLSQAEHDQRAGCLLLTNNLPLAEKVQKEIKKQLDTLPRAKIARKAVRKFGAIIFVPTLEKAAELANRIAPEHLELLVADPWDLLGRIRHAGAVFLGPFTPEAVGDYWAGPNHVLPTGGSARAFSPLSVEVFLKRSNLISFNRQAFDRAVGPVTLMARSEGFEGHARSMEIRRETRK
ncbi:MAG: histidinol dehydrogenase [Candidatus Glassbacteria bacterium]|nr:histidinol dehydrogenase [Candidatus Glassbacteria bacterium]